MENEDIHEMQKKDYENKDWSPKSHENDESYRDILVKDLERVPNKRGCRWRMKTPKSRKNKDSVEFIPASTLMMKPRKDNHPPQNLHDHPLRDQYPLYHLHDQQLGHHQQDH